MKSLRNRFFVLIILLALIGLLTIISNIRSVFNSPPTITATVILERVQALSQLTTVRYTYSSLVYNEQEMPGIMAALYGQKQVMVAVGHVNAGVNLGDLTIEDITNDGDTIFIQLPSPLLQDRFLNEQASYIVSRDTRLFSQGAPNLDTEAQRYAVHQFRDSALSESILDEAQQQTKVVIEEFLNLFLPEQDAQV